MCGGQNPFFIDEGSSTEMVAEDLQTSLPGPQPFFGILSPHNMVIQRCKTTYCDKGEIFVKADIEQCAL